jgi:hypothetical protein
MNENIKQIQDCKTSCLITSPCQWYYPDCHCGPKLPSDLCAAGTIDTTTIPTPTPTPPTPTPALTAAPTPAPTPAPTAPYNPTPVPPTWMWSIGGADGNGCWFGTDVTNLPYNQGASHIAVAPTSAPITTAPTPAPVQYWTPEKCMKMCLSVDTYYAQIGNSTHPNYNGPWNNTCYCFDKSNVKWNSSPTGRTHSNCVASMCTQPGVDSQGVPLDRLFECVDSAQSNDEKNKITSNTWSNVEI